MTAIKDKINAFNISMDYIANPPSGQTMKMHPKITERRLMNAIERQQLDLDDPGFCVDCGHEQDGVEPDARRYECEACGEKTVYGAMELAIRSPWMV